MTPMLDALVDRVALVTIDEQVDTLDGGPLEIPGTSAALPQMARLCAAFRSAGRPIVHVVRLYEADGSNAEPVRRELVSGRVPILRPGDRGRNLAPGLLTEEIELDDAHLLAGLTQAIGPTEHVVYKPRWGAFYRTPLEAHLRSLGTQMIFFGGCNFPNCPRTSIYEASERDYHVALVTDATSGLYRRAERELTNIGVDLVTVGLGIVHVCGACQAGRGVREGMAPFSGSGLKGRSSTVIAQVFHLGPPPAGAPVGPPPGAAQDAMKETRNADGCEGLYLMTPRDGGEGMAIVLWRDEPSLDAMRRREAEHLDEIRAETPDLPAVPAAVIFDVISA
jgi:nicotinamidase-related amidase